MFQWYKSVVFDNYANFNGRARRSEYWYFSLVSTIFSIAAMLIDKLLGSGLGSTGIIGGLYSLLVFIPSMAVSVRRLHDVGKSGWWLLVFFIVMIIAIAGVTISFTGLGSHSNSIGVS